MNKLNPATHALTVASDTLIVGTPSGNSANRSENSGRRPEHFAGCSEDSKGYSKNTQSASYAHEAQIKPAPVISKKSRPAGLFFNKSLVVLNIEKNNTN